MLRAALINPILLAIVFGTGMSVCRYAGINLHLHEAMLALTVFVIASEVALLPLMFQIKPTTLSLTQAALIGMVVHLMLAILLALAIMLLTKPAAAFAYWSLVFYWVTLAGLAFVFIRAVRQVPRTQG